MSKCYYCGDPLPSFRLNTMCEQCFDDFERHFHRDDPDDDWDDEQNDEIYTIDARKQQQEASEQCD